MDVGKLVAAYKYVFNSPEGQMVLEDLGVYWGAIPDPGRLPGEDTSVIGSDLTQSEFGYRACGIDSYNRINALISE